MADSVRDVREFCLRILEAGGSREQAPGAAGRRRTLVVQRIDGAPVSESPFAETLESCGFVSDYRGMMRVG